MDEAALIEQVRAALHEVLDPEIGESIVDLGLVERIEVRPAAVEVVLLPTSATCPMAGLLLDDAALAVQRALPGGIAVQARLDDMLSWTPQRMSPALRQRFGWPANAADAR